MAITLKSDGATLSHAQLDGNFTTIATRGAGNAIQTLDSSYGLTLDSGVGAATINKIAAGTGFTVRVFTNDGGSTSSLKFTFGSTAGAGNNVSHLPLTPITDNTYSLGTSSFRWSVVYAATGTINTSDGRLKTDISNSALGLNFIEKLRPVSYKFITGGMVPSGRYEETVLETEKNKDNPAILREPILEPVPGTRTHYGFISQEIKQTLDELNVGDFAGFVLTDKNDPNSEQGLRYEQFISPLVKAVQELSTMVKTLQTEVADLKSKVV